MPVVVPGDAQMLRPDAERQPAVAVDRPGQGVPQRQGRGLQHPRPPAAPRRLQDGLDRHQVHRRVADEAGDEGGGRAAIDLERRGVLHHLSRLHHRHPRGQRHRLGLVMGDVDRGHADVALQVVQEGPRLQPQLGVEVGERLVEQIDLRRVHQGPGQRGALLLAAGDLRRQPVQQMADLQDVRDLLGPAAPRLDGRAADLQRIADVLAQRHVRVQRIVLEHHREVAVPRRLAGDVGAADQDAAGGRLLQPRHHAQVVVLPQPDGPSRQTKSPSPMSRSMSRTTVRSPKAFGPSPALPKPSDLAHDLMPPKNRKPNFQLTKR